MNPLVTIIGHGKAQAVFQRHMLFWKRHELPMLVCCPKDDPIEIGLERFLVSTSEGAGSLAHLRLHQLLLHLSQSEHSHHVIFEYDSFSLKAKLDFDNGFFANVQDNAERERFIAHRYANFPWVIDAVSLKKMLEIALQYPAMTEHGHNDRWVSALAFLANVPLMHFRPKGASTDVWNDGNFKQLAEAVKAGATMIHGVKSEWIFDYLREQTQGL